jgi:hypothetical protein
VRAKEAEARAWMIQWWWYKLLLLLLMADENSIMSIQESVSFSVP